LTALALVALAEKAGVRRGVSTILTGNSSGDRQGAVASIRRPLRRLHRIDRSRQDPDQQAAVGVKSSGSSSAATPVLVFDDADIDARLKAPSSRNTATWPDLRLRNRSTPRTRSTTSSSKKLSNKVAG